MPWHEERRSDPPRRPLPGRRQSESARGPRAVAAEPLPLDTRGLLPFCAVGHQLGWVPADLADYLVRRFRIFGLAGGSLEMRVVGDDFAARSLAMRDVALALAADEMLPRWHGEECDCAVAGGAAVFRTDRAAFRTFGLRTHLVRVVALTQSGDLWAVESDRFDPGRLGPLTQSVVAAGETPPDRLRRLLRERAAIPPALAAATRPAGSRLVLQRVPEGVRNEEIHIYSLILPDDFVPTPAVGRPEFRRLSPDAVARGLLAGDFAADVVTEIGAFVTGPGGAR